MKLFIFRIIQGILIGSGAILPGISGGVLCVTFGIYKPLMDFLSSPIKTFRKSIKLILPILIGWVLGFWIFAKLITLFFDSSSNFAVALFVGLILGTIPSLFKEASEQGRNKYSWISLFSSFGLFMVLFILLNYANGINLSPNMWWFFFCGLLWGISVVVPGLTSASFLIFLGLYEPMTNGISSLNPTVLIPMLLGIAVSVLSLAKLISFVFRKFYSCAYHGVVGIVIASTLMIIPYKFASVFEAIISVVFVIVGIGVSYAMDIWGRKIKKNQNNN